MKKIAVLLVFWTLMASASYGSEVDSLRINRVFWGVGLDFSAWVEHPVEPLWRIGTDLLVHCGQHLSVGAFVGSAFLQWDAGVMASWRFADNSCLMGGLGYTSTFDTPLLRLVYKTRGRWYFSSLLGADFADNACHLGFGIGYSILGHKPLTTR